MTERDILKREPFKSDKRKKDKNAVFSRASGFCAHRPIERGFPDGRVFSRISAFCTQTFFVKQARNSSQKCAQSTWDPFGPQAGCPGEPGKTVLKRGAFLKRGKNSAFHPQANRSKRLRRELAVLAGLLLALCLSNFTGFASACAEVRADTLRLHILANSDSEADQALKLAVRDAILAEAGGLFAAGQTKQEALSAARQSLPLLQAIAEETLRANDCTDAVSVRLEELYFDTREYDDFTLPAGRYDAVRIEIGAHAGKNWFCVLFPPLCLPAATDEDVPDENAPAYSEAEQNAIHSPYRIRFAAVELLEGWKEALRPEGSAPADAASKIEIPENGSLASGKAPEK